ncbi:hypothetical protein Taro_042111 [Colocasia esculenta]|uniref:Uncharacterized protein n=1 Tax=Colocasia esculenta TaxID=4460 RepID=A0A843WYW5_COLES|nr:hypothetical protein [Colocasia esculenta]
MGVTKEDVEAALTSAMNPSYLVTTAASVPLLPPPSSSFARCFASLFCDICISFRPKILRVVDTSGGCGASFEIEIVSELFQGKRLLERHRMVNTALAEQLKQIHALSIKKVLSPDQWNPPPPQPEAAVAEPPPAPTAEA